MSSCLLIIVELCGAPLDCLATRRYTQTADGPQCRQRSWETQEANFSRLEHTTAPILPQHTLEAATADLAACKYPPRIMHSIDTTPHAAARRDSAARTRAPQRLRLSGTQPSNMWRCVRLRSEVTNQRIIDQKSFCDAGMVAALLDDGAAALRGCSDIGVSTAFLSALWPRAGVVWTGSSSSGNVDYSHTKTYVHARGILAAIGDSQRAPPRLARHARGAHTHPVVRAPAALAMLREVRAYITHSWIALSSA